MRVTVQQHLGVGMAGTEAMAVAFKLAPKRRMVIDFAIEHDHKTVLDAVHRLLSGLGVEHDQPAEA